jgi:hypothetical protein
MAVADWHIAKHLVDTDGDLRCPVCFVRGKANRVEPDLRQDGHVKCTVQFPALGFAARRL